MKLGIVICTYERPDLLAQCKKSILAADKPSDHEIVFVDDCSKNELTIGLLATERYGAAIKDKNTGIHDSLKIGFHYLIAEGCDILMNLDSDAIIKKNGIETLLHLHSRFSHTIVSGFNTLVPDAGTKKPRHPIVSEHKDYFTKKSIGGINMLMNKEMYLKYIEPELNRYNWDWRVCQRMQKDKKLFIVSNPSVVQHLGIKSAIGGIHNINPDIAHDF